MCMWLPQIAHISIMGSTGPNFVCPWCKRRNTHGYAIDGIDYPICSEAHTYSCMSLVLAGLSRNGQRAGALYSIVIQDEKFRKVHGALPEFFLRVSDMLYGRDTPGEQSSDRVYRAGFRSNRAMRLFYWEEHFVHARPPLSHPRGMLR